MNPRILTGYFLHTQNIYVFSPFVWIGLTNYDKGNNKENQNENIPVQEKELPQHILPSLAYLGFCGRFFLYLTKN